MKVSDIIAVIERTAPLAAAASWDASGVQVAAFRRRASSLAVMLDPTVEQLRRAVEAGADFILAHHPLCMKPRFPNVADEYLKALSVLLTGDIWLYSAHTSLDANPRGPVCWLGEALGLGSLRVLEPMPGLAGTTQEAFGFGFVGELPEPLAYADFCTRLASLLNKREWQCCGPMPESVRTLACCPGAGASLLPVVLDSGADIYITGDIKYHSALDAAAGALRVLDVGHFALEEEMMRRFAEKLAAELSVPVQFFPAADPLGPESALAAS